MERVRNDYHYADRDQGVGKGDEKNFLN